MEEFTAESDAERLRAQAELDAERLRAQQRRRSLAEELASIIEGSRWSFDDDEHDPEGSTIAFERAKIASLISATDAELRELDAAAARIDSGTYGVCERCGEPIAPIRLEALPTARRCISCSGRR